MEADEMHIVGQITPFGMLLNPYRNEDAVKFKTLTRLIFTLLFAVFITPLRPEAQPDHPFQISSMTFANNKMLPLSMINTIPINGVNSCTANGSPGGNQSPELSWTRPDKATRSFVVVAYDVTAAFTHSGIYNISANATGLPENAGIAGSTYGAQIVNDFGTGAEYGGPCPPANVEPFVHKYVFTVYALDIKLKLSSSTNFPANAETLYHALIYAGRAGHILESASIAGVYSSTRP